MVVSDAPPGTVEPPVPPPTPKVNGTVLGVAAVAPKLNCMGVEVEVAEGGGGGPPKEKGATEVVVELGAARVEADPAAVVDPNGLLGPEEKGEPVDVVARGPVIPKGGGTVEPMAVVEGIAPPPPVPVKEKVDPKGVLVEGAVPPPAPPPPPPKVNGPLALLVGEAEEGALVPIPTPVPAATVALLPNPKAPPVVTPANGDGGAPKENPPASDLAAVSAPAPPALPVLAPKLKEGTADDLERDDSPVDVAVLDPNVPKAKVVPVGTVEEDPPPPAAALDVGMGKVGDGAKGLSTGPPPTEGSIIVPDDEADLPGPRSVPKEVKVVEGATPPIVVVVLADGLTSPAVMPNVNEGGAPSRPVNDPAWAVPLDASLAPTPAPAPVPLESVPVVVVVGGGKIPPPLLIVDPAGLASPPVP